MSKSDTIFENRYMTEIIIDPIEPRLARYPGYSLRRHFVDGFHFRHVRNLPRSSLVLDLGGNRLGKRGFFDIEEYGLQVVYANLSIDKKPDVKAVAEHLPFRDGSFDAVICSELLEHVLSPPAVLAEIYRLLRKGGTSLICVPFMNRVHGDPFDYGRYTDWYWLDALQKSGFANICIEKQGLFWSVLMDMLRDLAYTKAVNWKDGIPLRLLSAVLATGKRKALEWDAREDTRENKTLAGFTTGFGIRAIKNE
ncbi:MAG TPA: class I SAM-dependent methyltransferase [Desulfomonilaceae bacterium]|nr:class I SAM-dependent methyltransferase [Desulfomonilaceae bacterium]